MTKALLKFKDIEFLIKKQMPDLDFKNWTSEGAIVDIDITKVNHSRERWKDIIIYKFEAQKGKKVEFVLRQQVVSGASDQQLIIQ
jgi:hypothetical protein